MSDYFTSGSGITVIFESALVPNLFASTITLNNVYVSRRPADARVPSLFNQASSPLEAKAADSGFKFGPEDHREHAPLAADDGSVEDDGNYTQFDLNIDRIEVELSFVRWLNGEGLIKSAVVSGVRGVLGMYFSTLSSRTSWTWLTLETAVNLDPRPPIRPLGPVEPLDPARVAAPGLAR